MTTLAFLAIRGTVTPVIVVAVVFFFIYLMSRAAAADKDRKERRKLVERAMQHGAIDEALKRELLDAVAERTPVREHRRSRTSPWVAIGWIGFCVGLVMLFMPDLREAGAIVAAVGFGMLSVPFAAREIEARRHA